MSGQQGGAPSAGANMSFSPTAVEQNGMMQRQLQSSPTMGQAPQSIGGNISRQGLEMLAANPGAGMQAGGPFAPPIATSDPNVAASMQQMQGLLAASKQKKAQVFNALMGMPS